MIRTLTAVIAGVLMLAIPVTSDAASLYFAEPAGGTTPAPFGTIDATGAKTYIGLGLDFGGDINKEARLLSAPNGDVYGFNFNGLSTNRWGRIDTATGGFTTLGDLRLDFPFIGSGSGNPQFSFDGSGTLYATGFVGSSTYAYGTLDLTSGAFNTIATGGAEIATSLAAAGSTSLYFAESAGGTTPAPFGTIDATGAKTYIGPGLDFGGDINKDARLLSAPNGDLFGFNFNGSGTNRWGRIDTATGGFTTLGDLRLDFPFIGSGSDEPQFAFDASGNLYAAGFIGSSTYAYGTLDLTSGAFNPVTTAGFPIATGLAPGPVVPLPAAAWMGAALLGGLLLRRQAVRHM